MSVAYRPDKDVISTALSTYRRRYGSSKDYADIVALLTRASQSPLIELPACALNTDVSVDSDLLKQITSQGRECLMNPFFTEAVYECSRYYVYVRAEDGYVSGLIYAPIGAKDIPLLVPWRAEMFEGEFFAYPLMDNRVVRRSAQDVQRAIVANLPVISEELLEAYRRAQQVGKHLTEAALDMESASDHSERAQAVRGALRADVGYWRGRDLSSYYSTVHEVFTTVSAIIQALGYLHIHDYFSVSVTSQRYAKALRRHRGPAALMPSGPKVRMIQKQVFDGMLSESGTQALTCGVVPHRRRGTWVTLRAQRYRHHPMYQVKNGVYRKETWVGPKEFVQGDLTYRVIE